MHQHPRFDSLTDLRHQEAGGPRKCPRLRAELVKRQLDLLERCDWALHLDAKMLWTAAAELRQVLRNNDAGPGFGNWCQGRVAQSSSYCICVQAD